VSPTVRENGLKKKAEEGKRLRKTRPKEANRCRRPTAGADCGALGTDQSIAIGAIESTKRDKVEIETASKGETRKLLVPCSTTSTT
jgi:hypothetical protein